MRTWLTSESCPGALASDELPPKAAAVAAAFAAVPPPATPPVAATPATPPPAAFPNDDCGAGGAADCTGAVMGLTPARSGALVESLGFILSLCIWAMALRACGAKDERGYRSRKSS